MKTLKFETKINASAEKIWNKLWDDKNYREWASVFSEGSYAESDWKEGSPIKFLGPSGDGMYSKIKTKVPNKKMTFEHLGSIKDGKEISSEWAGALEEYVLDENSGATKISVSIGIIEEYQDYFEKTFPKALQKIKELSEN